MDCATTPSKAVAANRRPREALSPRSIQPASPTRRQCRSVGMAEKTPPLRSMPSMRPPSTSYARFTKLPVGADSCFHVSPASVERKAPTRVVIQMLPAPSMVALLIGATKFGNLAWYHVVPLSSEMSNRLGAAAASMRPPVPGVTPTLSISCSSCTGPPYQVLPSSTDQNNPADVAAYHLSDTTSRSFTRALSCVTVRTVLVSGTSFTVAFFLPFAGTRTFLDVVTSPSITTVLADSQRAVFGS